MPADTITYQAEIYRVLIISFGRGSLQLQKLQGKLAEFTDCSIALVEGDKRADFDV